MTLRILGVGLAAVLVIGAAAFFLFRGTSGGVLVESPRLVATDTQPGDAMVFMTLTNTSDTPDILIGAVSDYAGNCGFHGPTVGRDSKGEEFVVVPPGGSTALSAETAHLELLGIDEPLREGQLIPMTLIFQNAGEVAIKARVEALVPRSELTLRAGLYEPSADEPVPAITLTAQPEGEGRWRIAVDIGDFDLDKSAVDSAHVPNQGHAHYYIDNVKIGRLFAPEFVTDPLPPGPHQIAVTLNTNDHRAYAKDGRPITATITVEN
jgi:copper(I)-binding protein